MRVVMTLLVRDEADVVDCNLAYHLGRGVDAIIVTDHRSQDGTRERLAAWANADPRVLVLHEDREACDQSTYVTRMARVAQPGDWVLNNDADEFLWPEAGDLRAALLQVPRSCSRLELARLNFVARPDDRRPFFERMTTRQAEAVDELGRPLRRKLAHRAGPRVVVGRGSHAVRGAPWPPRTCRRPLVTVLHFPARTLAQYRHKVEIGGATPGYEHKRIAAAHAALLHGELDARYEAEAGARDGLIEDTRLRDYLASGRCEKWEALLSTHGRHD
ncbi:MAG TPA: glycosyltransferase family 2 protein [Solirubrobacteraceae bacterium]|nr:glycosyltransferase family 2 protein [Solirubrobacteraceae bacterium]